MKVRNRGKYTNMSRNRPRAIATCDRSGFMVQHDMLVKQDEYAGKGKIYLGYLVHPDFYDIPNAQNLTPPFRLDPRPIPNARPDSIVGAETTIASSIGVLGFPVSNVNITITQEQFITYGSFNFTGVLTTDIVVFIPNIFRQFYANKLTTGNFEITIQTLGNNSLPLTLPPANPITLLGPLITNTFYNLQFS